MPNCRMKSFAVFHCQLSEPSSPSGAMEPRAINLRRQDGQRTASAMPQRTSPRLRARLPERPKRNATPQMSRRTIEVLPTNADRPTTKVDQRIERLQTNAVRPTIEVDQRIAVY